MSRPRLTLSHSRRPEARRALAKTSNTLALAATVHLDRLPDAPDDYWKDLRRGRRWIWGGLLRWIDRCAAIGTPLPVILTAIDAVRAYACDLYGVSDEPSSRAA